MIILQNKNDEFVKEINKITFSDDIKERIINRISKQKGINRRIYISTAAVVIIILSITIASNLITTNKNNNNYLTAENIEATENEIAISVDIDSDIDNIEINPNQKIIINIQNIQNNTTSVEFNAHLIGDDKEYSFGYIVDQNYTELASDCTEEYINNEIDTKAGSEYSLYLINHSEKILTLSGNIFANYNDLVYRDYGSNAVEIDDNSTIIIDLSSLSDTDDIEGIYIYNCVTKQTIRWELADTIEYKSEQGGTYLIYAMTIDGEYIDLLDKVKIETSAKGANEFIIGL
jgi:hypothetical protein